MWRCSDISKKFAVSCILIYCNIYISIFFEIFFAVLRSPKISYKSSLLGVDRHYHFTSPHKKQTARVKSCFSSYFLSKITAIIHGNLILSLSFFLMDCYNYKIIYLHYPQQKILVLGPKMYIILICIKY